MIPKIGLLKFYVWKVGNSRLASSSGFGACSEKKIGLSCCQRTCWCGNWLYRALRSWCHFPRRITDIEVGKLLKNRPQPQQPSRRRTSFQHRDSNQRKRHIPSMYAHTNSPLFGKKKAKKKIFAEKITFRNQVTRFPMYFFRNWKKIVRWRYDINSNKLKWT